MLEKRPIIALDFSDLASVTTFRTFSKRRIAFCQNRNGALLFRRSLNY